MLSGLEYFLGLRLLIALQAAGLDTKLLTAPLNALIALLVVPFVVQTGFALYRAGYQAWLKVVGHPRTVLYWLLVVVALGGIYWMTPFSFKRFALPAGFVSVAPFGMAAGGLVLDRCFSWFLHHPRRTLLLCLFAAAPVAFRFVTLLAFGWQERMSGLGSGVAVSVYYTPWALLVFAGLWHFREKIGASWVIYVIMVVVILVATPILARDYGAGLIFSIPVFLLFALPLVQYPKKLVSWLYASPFLGTLCLHLGMLLIPVLGFTNQGPGGRGDAMARAKQDKAFAEAVLEQRLLISDYNKLRVLGQLSPDKLNQIGTVKSERLGLVFANLQIYGARGALGTGFLNTERAPSLGAHVSDYVSSVHVLAPFGWLGSLAVLGLAVGLGFGPLIQFRKAGLGTFDSMRKAFGLVTVWTLACAALYMFSANIGLVMFTGKNVYLLAVDSNSDLLEGTLLFGLALWAFHDTGKGTV
ncbi:hypothetical protein [Acanthopleuribacter pedis]|uniref:Uncharacterized protein n=1 Tax=Acanthopleuribacter pedis TaxID=442870 RepID=A0A8J7Q7G7_9BACT|nr:hypothetical protein [Acanthopleuribacter pedis]MBO1319741.1 hypothetical protein [Acanthopleuribacter pedis]